MADNSWGGPVPPGEGRWPWETAKTAKFYKAPTKSTTKTTSSTSTPKPTTGLTVTNPFTGAKTTYSAADVAALKAKSDAARAEWGQKSFGIPIATPAKPIMASNYGAGAAGAVMGKAATPKQEIPTPLDSNIQKVLGGIGGGSAGGVKPFSADDLYLDPTPQFQPLLDLYNQQQKQLNERYAANAADIKNIFGNLTTVRAQDKAKIAQQFKTSIEQQQAALAGRTAEARAGVAAGQQGAATAAAEMGTAGQPAPSDSLTAQAAEQGIADSNAYQTTWSALQNVMSQQAQNDVQNAIQGYDYQQTAALETLRNNLEDRLAGIQANMAGTQSDIAGAQLAGKQNVLNAKYAEEQARQAAIAKMQQAAASAANKPTTYPKTVTGWQQKVNDLGFIPNDISSSIQYAKTLANRALNANLKPGEKPRSATKAQVWDYWMKNNGGADETAVALEYLNLLPK